ncbi:MAG: hypothetical protein ACI4LE_01295, partial [Faecalibacterium sp.]
GTKTPVPVLLSRVSKISARSGQTFSQTKEQQSIDTFCASMIKYNERTGQEKEKRHADQRQACKAETAGFHGHLRGRVVSFFRS